MGTFAKYHALGNDYIVLDESSWGIPSESVIQRICHRHFGVGSDGILLRRATREPAVRIFNPDGSEAEKSGNGLRIFCRYLWDEKVVTDGPFQVETLGGMVRCQVLERGRSVTVDMGRVSLDSSQIPVNGPRREVLNETLKALDRDFTFTAATIGNPHCVIFVDDLCPEMAHRYGPIIERHELFPRRTNVQFASVLDRANIRLEIWERGAGYTLASGSSSSAAAAVAFKHGVVGSDVTVHMPGGQLRIELTSELDVRMSGPVVPIARGTFDLECFEFTTAAFRASNSTQGESAREETSA